MEHVIIYREPGRYAGWPANYGIWSWGNEIVVGFTVGYHKEDGTFHARDRSRPFVTMQARSTDGGRTWKTSEIPARTPGNRALSADEHMEPGLHVANVLEGENAPAPCPGTFDFTHPDFALMCARSGLGGGTRSWFYLSTDRCRSWQGPYRLPMFGQKGIAARTDYIVTGPKECLLFLTAAMDTEAGSRVFCARTQDGGASFEFVSWISPPQGQGFHIMPASVRLSGSRLLVAVRSREDMRNSRTGNWIDLYESKDNGVSWSWKSRPVTDTGNGGNPPTLTRLMDGRLCLTYGYRNAPYGIRAKLSEDNGESWGSEIVLRDDAGSHDIGYPRTTQLADGTLVTAYYYNDRPGGECYIAATRWKA